MSPLSSAVTCSDELNKLLSRAKSVTVASSIEQLQALSLDGIDNNYIDVTYDLPYGATVLEATVCRVRNGISVNYPDPYMRRRDPHCMVIADDFPTDKPKFADRFNEDFSNLRGQTIDWLAGQDLLVLIYNTGQPEMGDHAIAIVPKNAAFFALGLAMMQGLIPKQEVPKDFVPKSIIYIAPPFRHTYFEGKQVVVHNRLEDLHEIFAYNLYPGPSAKKGVYGALIRQGIKEGWVTAHCSAVKIITPYDNVVTIMHEGASGGGKSEMLEQPHRQPDGLLRVGRNIVTGEERFVEIPRTCKLRPVCDDMALCHPDIQTDNGKLWLTDAEEGWFVRVNHITEYGADLNLEKLTAQPSKDLLFFNIDAVPGSRALIWEHIEDEPGKPCPNPRVIIPRDIVPNIEDEPLCVDIRSFGVRTPPCTRENPTYGIIGMFHVLPPALAWLWRLVAPRGYANPSVVETGTMDSEGVGSYWPFATGLRVEEANLLYQQIVNTPNTGYILTPNQNIGAWDVGFMPNWLARDFLARRGGVSFSDDQITPARSSLLGYALKSMRIEGIRIARRFLEVDKQAEVGRDGYDAGAQILQDFFDTNLKTFLVPDLNESAKNIIQCCLDRGTVEDYKKLM